MELEDDLEFLSIDTERPQAGEEGAPATGSMPLAQPLPPRVPGSAAGHITIAEDFDAPLPAALLDAFEGMDRLLHIKLSELGFCDMM